VQNCCTVESLGYVSVQISMHGTVGVEKISCSEVIIPSVIQQILHTLFNPTFHDHFHKSISQFVLTLATLIRSTPSF
jgi:hypothetical protein